MNSVILIPSLNPDEKLVEYVDRLVEYGFDKIIVINDGSASEYDSFFDQVAAHEQCVVLRHEVNKGKGAALKTGMRYYLDHYSGCDGIVTGDADGQHSLKDTARLADMLAQDDHSLILGSRDFSLENVPKRSRFGNRTTSTVFKMTHGQWLNDTQTGLRAIPDGLVGLFATIDGERYEYEMNMLIECADRKIPIVEETIETIYLNENTGSHFRAVRDSVRVYWLILRSIVEYLASGLLSFLVDIALFRLLDKYVFTSDFFNLGAGALSFARTFGAAGVARIGSSVVNFTVNKKLVFRKNGGTVKSAGKYIALVVFIYALSSSVVSVLRLLMPQTDATIIKMCVDAVLVLVSFSLQRAWVFKKRLGD